MKNSTVPGGVHVIASFLAENEEQKEKVIRDGRYYFTPGELKDYYSDFTILQYEEHMGKRETHGLPRHRHYMVKMIAQKN